MLHYATTNTTTTTTTTTTITNDVCIDYVSISIYNNNKHNT